MTSRDQAYPRILMMGCGSVGGVLAAGLLGAGYDVTIVTRNPAISSAISSNGLYLVTPAGRRTLAAAICADSCPNLASTEGTFDIALLSMKATDVLDAAAEVAPLLSNKGYVVTLQNGIVEDAVAAVVGRDRVVGAIVGWGATMHRPGIYEMTSRGETVIGELDGDVTERVLLLREVLAAAAPAAISKNITGALWSKLAINCAITSLGAITGETLGALLGRRNARSLALAIVSEVLDTAEACKLTLEPVAGTLDLARLYVRPDRRKRGFRLIQIRQHLLIRAVGLKYRRLRSSMLQSLERGREPEIDYLNGYVVDRAREEGICVPVNSAITVMVHEIAAGGRRIDPTNLAILAAAA